MKKTTVTTSGLLWLLLLLGFSTTPLINVSTVAADNASLMWGSTWNMTDGEEALSDSVCAAIRYHFSLTGEYDYLHDYYGEETEKMQVLYNVTYCNDNYDFTSIFYKGHGCHEYHYNPTYGWVPHYWLYDDDGGSASDDKIYDQHVGYRATAGTHDLVFLWACGTGDDVGHIGNYNYTWYMPASWCFNDDLSDDGFNDPDEGDDCFLGFINYSKPFDEYTGYQSYKYSAIANGFYVRTTLCDETVNEALNVCANYYLGDDLDSTDFYNEYWYYDPDMGGNSSCRFVVYGNGDITIPN